jgi:hypothetical protein
MRRWPHKGAAAADVYNCTPRQTHAVLCPARDKKTRVRELTVRDKRHADLKQHLLVKAGGVSFRHHLDFKVNKRCGQFVWYFVSSD